MSEKAPGSVHPRLENFEANKAAYEAEQEELARKNYDEAFIGEAGHTDFSSEALQTLQDEEAYQLRRESTPQEESADGYYDRMLHEADEREHDGPYQPVGPYLPVEGTLEHAEHEAYAEKENREAEEAAYAEAEQRAIDAKVESNPQLRRMNDLAREIAELRAQTDPKDPDALIDRVQKREDALNELLEKYENNELYTIDRDKVKQRVEYDPAVANEIINRTKDEELEAKNSEAARRGADNKDDNDLPVAGETDLDDDSIPKAGETDLEDPDDGEDIPKAGETDLNEPDDGEDIPKAGESDLDELDGMDIPKAGETDLPEPELTREMPREEETFKGPLGRLEKVLRDRRLRKERGEKPDSKEKKKLFRIAIGAAAITATTVVGAILISNGLPWGGGGSGVREVIDGSTGVGGGSGDAAGSSLDFASTDIPGGSSSVDTLPASGDFTYPWDWAREAKGEEQATTWLHELSEKAENAGYNVEWHGSGTQEWVEINGNSNTKDVLDVLRRFA